MLILGGTSQARSSATLYSITAVRSVPKESLYKGTRVPNNAEATAKDAFSLVAYSLTIGVTSS